MTWRRGVALGGLLAAIAACSSSPMAPNGQMRVLAPIERVEINVAESFPPQYFASIVSVQSNACVAFDQLETSRDGRSILIVVWNLAPTAPDLACAQVISTTQHNVALGTGFESGRAYELRVNDVIRAFTAQ